MKDIEKDKNQKQSRAISNNLETTSENKGLSMMPPPFQFKSMQGEEEKGKKLTIQKKSNPNGMPEKVQTKMENAFGQDFSNVNIHTNSSSSKDMGALAYAQGNDVHFASGQYDPQSQKGQELLGHELTHVVQQREGRVKPTTQAKGVAVNDDKKLEKEADDMGKKVVQGKAVNNQLIQQKESKSPFNKKQRKNVVQRKETLAEWVAGLSDKCREVDQAVLDLIHGSSVAERQAILNNATYRKYINTSLGSAATVFMSALLEGSHSWKNPTDNDFYNYFVNGKGKLPNTSTMNCWESILYAAYLAGQINTSYIRKFYKKALGSSDPNAQIWKSLGFSTSLSEYPAATPTAGQLIFYLPSGAAVPSHIALSQGGDVAMSLWNQPNKVYSVQRITINQLKEKGTRVFIGNPQW